MNDKINLDDLYKQKQFSVEKKTQIYEKILKRVHKKIQTSARNKNNICFCTYIIPEFILGLPRYNIEICTDYIIDKLIKNGFQVKYTHPNLIFISWQHYIPLYERQEYKKKTGISIDGFGNVLKNKKNKKNNENPNSLLLKEDKNVKIQKNNDKNFKDISNYKPSAKFIYDNELMLSIKNLNI